MEHILEEKIKHATADNMKKRVVNNEPSKDQVTSDTLTVKEERINFGSKTEGTKNAKTKRINGEIKGETEKAYLIKLESEEEHWIPKSTIDEIDESKTTFTVAEWILKKNKIIS